MSLKATAVITCDGSIRSRLLLSPGRHKNCDVTVTSLQEPINSQLDALTGEHLFISMTARAKRKVEDTLLVGLIGHNLLNMLLYNNSHTCSL